MYVNILYRLFIYERMQHTWSKCQFKYIFVLLLIGFTNEKTVR